MASSVPLWHSFALGGVRFVGVHELRNGESLRQARDAETAHLDAILKDHGPRALRLARLHDILRNRGAAGESFELQAGPGVEPRLWLDLKSCVTVLPDGRTYKLSTYGRDRIDIVLETETLDEMVVASERQLAHGRVVATRQGSADSQPPAPPVSTLVYVWMIGLFTGVALFALFYILFKNKSL